MSSPAQTILDRLPDHKRASGGWKAKCPAHDDQHASLSVKEYPDGSAGVKCFAGCATDQILRALGMERKDLFVPSAPTAGGQRKRVHTYADEAGKPFSRKTVIAYPDGGKRAIWEHSEDGGKTWLKDRGERRALYNLPAVLEAIAEGKPIYLNEGEKGADACNAVGLVGTSHGGGASEFPLWASETLRGAKVVVVVDRDSDAAKGPAWARYLVGPKLKGLAKGVRFVQSKTTGEGDDAWDHFSQGGNERDFVHRNDLSGVTPARVETLNGTFQPVVLEHLWWPYLPKGKGLLCDGDGGVGKTSLVLAFAACLSQGILPNGDGSCDPVKTLYLHKEEDPSDELETIYRACGGVPGMISYCTDLENLDERGCAMLEATIHDGGYKLVVIDALFYFLQGMMKDSHQAFDVMAPMLRIMGIYRSTGATGIHIRHTSKGIIGKAASDLGLGSVQFRNSHRGQLVALRHPDVRGLVIVQDTKGSILNPQGESFAYRRTGNAVEWVQTFDDPFTPNLTTPADAREWLIALLARGPQSCEDVQRAAKDAGMSWKTVRGLKGVAIKRKGGYQGSWVWSLSPSVDPFDDRPGDSEQPQWWAE